ncbi:MAG TPA: Uma2 family endonuclease [Methylobacterium sp.]|jgi:Uma2 family endonuclease
MAEPAPRRWTVEAFFAWQQHQAERYELIDGFPVRMMAGARNVHDDIVVNVLAALKNRLGGTGCRPFTGDGSVETLPGQIRRPDAGVDCGRRDPDGLKAALPRLVVEVLSPSSRDFDAFEKLDEYKTVDSLEYILLIEPNAPEAFLWSRGPERVWRKRPVRGLGEEIALPELGTSLPMAEIYDGVEIVPRPRLVEDDGA